MPFTFSHPALVVPFCWVKQRYRSMTGLVIGSLAPDFEYFFRMKKGTSLYSHSWEGLFWFDLPLSVLLGFVFHNVVKKDIYNNLPGVLKSRVGGYYNFNWNVAFRRNFIVIILSILAGSAGHILWDESLHKSVYYIYNLPRAVDINDSKVLLAFYYKLWAVNSLAGMVVVVLCLLSLRREVVTPVHHVNSSYWAFIGVVTIVVSIIRMTFNRYLSIDDIAVTIMAAFLLAVLLRGIWSKVYLR
jgi:hypothetical protein